MLQKPKSVQKIFGGRFGPDTEAERVLKMVQKVNSGKVQNKGVVIARARAEKRWHLRCSLPLRVHSGNNKKYLFERLILTFAQIERLCELLHKRFAVGICDIGDPPPEGYSWTLYVVWGQLS